MGKRPPPSDPAFAEEMARLADDRRQQQIGTFREEWKARLERGEGSPLFPSSLHRHDPSCWTEPYRTVLLNVNITVRRCERTGTIVEVK